MTVAELIEELERVKDKSLPVTYYDEHWEPEVSSVKDNCEDTDGRKVVRIA